MSSISQPASPKAAAPPGSAAPARAKKRHYGILISLVAGVILPGILSAAYLFAIAHDQYSSKFGFSVRSEEITSAQGLLGGLASISGSSSSSDTDILHEFIQSRTLIDRIDERLDLATIYSRPSFDPVFAYDPAGTIEDLVGYWQRMVHVSYSNGTGLIEVRVNAFTPQDAYAIASAIVEESSQMINNLSTIARKDATRYAREDLEAAVARLKSAREDITRFRSRTQIVDPNADIQGQMGLLNSLESQLAEAVIDLNLLMETTGESDPRIKQAKRRITVIKSLIEKERRKFGFSSTSDAGSDDLNDAQRDYSRLVGEFERLVVEREYAEKSYLSAQTALDSAQAESQRQSRYLAIYADPAVPQSAQYPRRVILTVVIFAFLFLGWCIGVLVYYGIRDRK